MIIDISLEGSNQLKENLKKFNIATWSIGRLYLACLGKYQGGVFKKAIIEVSRELAASEVNLIEDKVNVVEIHKTFDFELFFQLEDNYAKKKMLLEVLHDGMTLIAKHEGWDINQLQEAYDCCIKRNLEFRWLINNKYHLSPDKKYYAAILCDWDIDKFEVSAVFFNKSKEEIVRTKLFEVMPNDIQLFGKMAWDEGTGEFCLFSKNEKQKWSALPPI